ncbi:glutamyl-tRNA reductase [Stigmatella sp. ncwal1]|uniref:Glutamyl-tRNA reductase n=1 Tax=Stigmatella ashevillensis TaxID=2995309 RepID=A0ABT5D1K4_9BACT|nr:glutamyl-tRNA reductase [Stigmatella ashevillena]MDC0707546.1 glutamyl-tRNA reductase [Stigmatella ashevillena]
MEWVCVGLSHRTAPLAVRERLSMTEVQQMRLLHQGSQGPHEAMTVATCNRVEVYVATPDPALARAWVREALGRLGGPEVLEHLYEYEGPQALEHLFRVASSLDSRVVGEAQILGQLKKAFEQARQMGAARGGLTRVCAAAFACAKRVRTETAIGRAATSVAPAVVALACQVFGTLSDKTVLLVGAGEMGGLAARYLRQAEAGRLLIINRTPSRAEALAAEVGGSAHPFEALNALLAEADVVVCSTASPVPLLTRESVRAVGRERQGRPLFLADLSVPRNIAPDVALLEGVTAYDVDGLQQFAGQNEAARAAEARKAEVLISQEISRFLRDRAVRQGVPVLAQLRQRAEQLAKTETDRTLAGLGEGLTHKQRQSIEAMGRAIVNKLLHEPTLSLRTSVDDDDFQALADATARLFGLRGGREQQTTPAAAGSTPRFPESTHPHSPG